jgi:hypothetical protein
MGYGTVSPRSRALSFASIHTYHILYIYTVSLLVIFPRRKSWIKVLSGTKILCEEKSMTTFDRVWTQLQSNLKPGKAIKN